VINVKVIEIWGDVYLVTKTDSDLFYVRMRSLFEERNGSRISSLFLDILSEKFEESSDGA